MNIFRLEITFFPLYIKHNESTCQIAPFYLAFLQVRMNFFLVNSPNFKRKNYTSPTIHFDERPSIHFRRNYLRCHPIKCIGGRLFTVDGRFDPKKEFCHNRLPAAYLPSAKQLMHWRLFLDDLLEPDDIPALQEFFGYALLPVTKAQKMLILIGKGGEGKFRVGLMLRSLLGENMNSVSIQKVETDRFARANLEYK